MKIIIRPTKFLDINQMMELNQRALPENYNREFWSQKFYEGKTHSFVATWATLVIGYIFCDETTIISFAIDEKFRGKGLGKQLLYCCLNTYNKPVRLHVRVSNEIALKLYRSVGFVEEEKMSEYYSNPTEGAYQMIRKLTNIKYEEKRKLNIT